MKEKKAAKAENEFPYMLFLYPVLSPSLPCCDVLLPKLTSINNAGNHLRKESSWKIPMFYAVSIYMICHVNMPSRWFMPAMSRNLIVD
jgi:hypothetical protein